MSVSNEHLGTVVNTWDGTTYELMDKKEAAKLEREHKIQIVDDLQARDLMTAAEFANKQMTAAATKAKRKNYKTRELKAEA